MTETTDDVSFTIRWPHVGIDDGGTDKLNPRRFKSLLNVRIRVLAGISRVVFQRLSFGRPSTNRQQ